MYDGLFEAGREQSFFFSRGWFQLLTDVASSDFADVRIYAAESKSGEPMAILPLVGQPGRSFWSPRVLSAFANYYTPLFAPLVSPDAGREFVLGIVRRIVEERRWDIVDLQPLPLREPDFTTLDSAFRNSGFLTQRYFRFANWYLKVDGRSFAKYYEALPATLRNTLRRKSRGLAARHEVRVAIVSGQEQGLERAIADYEVVYAASWKLPEPHRHFIGGLIRLAATDGSLRLGTLYVDDQPVATQLWLVSHGRAAIYKLAHDERFAAWSVGSQLTLALMRHALDIDKVCEVDYLTGDDPYKRNWMSHRRERWGIFAFDPRRPRGISAAMYHLGGRALKNALAFRRS
jgi:CelD/BcsL family acetyltransferase involved in cellulose biosynthesis